jgi:hypothetical protein
MFPFDILEQAFQGNSVAWYAIIFGIGAVGLLFFNIFLWWKMPQLAKAMFINNTIGGNKPTMAQCYDTKRVKFFNPEVLRSGMAVLKNSLYIFPKAWAGADDLTPSERDIFNAVYTIDGTQSAFFVNYALQAGVLNPGLVAYIEHEKLLQQLKPGQPVNVDKNEFIEVLKMIPEDKVQIAPLHFSFPISDIRNLKTWLSKSLSKSNFVELEYKIRQDERGDKEGLNLQTILVLLVLIQILIGGISLAKMMGWI